MKKIDMKDDGVKVIPIGTLKDQIYMVIPK